MKDFFSPDFMLDSPLAIKLYRDHASKMPIFDYHCHLSAKDIYEDRPFKSLGQLWFLHDHYKWRLMRGVGAEEYLVSGKGDDYQKFLVFIKMLYKAIGNPILHWSYLELKDVFGIKEPLTLDNAREIWDRCNSMIREMNLSPRKLLELYRVNGLCTTEDASANLSYHEKLAIEYPSIKVIPTFRPDKVLNIKSYKFFQELEDLRAFDLRIENYQELKQALVSRMDAFCDIGCVVSDHDLNAFSFSLVGDEEMEEIFKKAVCHKELSDTEAVSWKCTLLVYLFSEYSKRGWKSELHTGCNRDQNMKMVRLVGEAAGYDSPGDFDIALPLGSLLNYLEENGILTKTILFSLNPKDLWPLARLCYTFHEEGFEGKIQLGTAWWMQDHKKGIIEHMDALANTGILGSFIGMLTDSRSFLSYSRHDYFRRILCSYVAAYVEKGEYPYIDYLGNLVEDICYKNTIRYFFD